MSGYATSNSENFRTVTDDALPVTAPVDVSRAETLASAVAGVAVLVGFALRLMSALHLSPHIDEAASILAANVVASDVLPVLPSGTVYFQGYTLSLVLAPLVWLGFGDLDHLLLMRMVSVVAGTATIHVLFVLARSLSGSVWTGALAASLLAIDPISVQWGGHVRMYALLQLIVVLLALSYGRLVSDGVTLRRAGVTAALAWAAVFTHVGVGVVVAALLLSILVTFRGDVMRDRRLLTLLFAVGSAPVALLLANALLSPEGMAQSGDATSSGLWFVGNSQIELFGLLGDEPRERVLAALRSPGPRVWLIPATIVLVASAVASFAQLMRRRDGWTLLRPGAASFVFLAYWLTVIGFVLFSKAFVGRYLLHVHTIGYVFVAVLIVAFARLFTTRWSMPGLVPGPLTSGAVVAVVLILLGQQVQWRFEHPVLNADYHAAMDYVAGHHTPGRPVIAALPPPVFLGLEPGSRDDLYFLAGPADGARAKDYSRITPEGQRVDYWVGAETIVSANGLRQLLLGHPDAMLVIDAYRLTAPGAYGGEIEGVIRELTMPIYQGPGGVLVMVPEPSQIGPRPLND